MKNYFSLSLHNYRILEEDIKDELNKVTSLYVIDTYDIVEYCFPLITNKNIKWEDLKKMKNYYSSYQLFFKKNICLLFNEYYDEVIRFQNKIKWLADSEYSFEDLYEMYVKKIDDPKSFVSNNLGLILSIYLGLKGGDSAIRYKALMEEHLVIEKFENQLQQDNFEIEELLKTTYPNYKECNDFFLFYINQYGNYFYDESKAKRYEILNKTLTDIKVISRIYELNKRLQKSKNIKAKHKFKLFSSTPKKTEKLVNAFAFYKSDLDVKKLVPVRTIINYHLFENLKNKDNKLNDYLKDIGFCNYSMEQNENLTTKELQYFQSKEINITNNYFNIEIEKLNPNIFKNLKSTENDELIKQSIVTLLNLIKGKGFQLIALKTYNLESKAFNISNLNTSKIIIPLSRDAIKSYIQSFPILLLNHQLYQVEEYVQWILDLIDPNDYYDGNSEYIYKTKSIDILKIQPYLKHFQTDIFTIFLQLVLDSNQINDPALYNKNSQFNIQINETFSDNIHIKNSLDEIDLKITDFLSSSEKFSIDDIYENWNYLKLWIFRRDNKFIEGFKVEKRISPIYKDSIKINHALGLLHYSFFYYLFEHKYNIIIKNELSQKYKNIILQHMKLSTEYLEKVGEIFSKWAKSEGGSSINIYKKLSIGLFNTLCDIEAQKYWIENSIDNIRKFDRTNGLSPIKELFINEVKNKVPHYNLYPAFNHTEFDIELCELDVLIKNKQLKESRILINYMKKREMEINSSLLLQNHYHLKSFSLRKFDQLAQFAT